MKFDEQEDMRARWRLYKWRDAMNDALNKHQLNMRENITCIIFSMLHYTTTMSNDSNRSEAKENFQFDEIKLQLVLSIRGLHCACLQVINLDKYACRLSVEPKQD